MPASLEPTCPASVTMPAAEQASAGSFAAQLAAACPAPLVAVTPELTIAFASLRARRAFGLGDDEDLAARSILEFVDRQDQPRAEARFRQLIGEGEPGASAYRLRPRHRDSFVAEITSSTLRSPDGTITAIALLIREVDSQRPALAALSASELRFAQMLNRNPIATGITRLRDGVFVDVNAAFLQFSGYTRAEVIGRASADLCLWADPVHRDDVLRRLRAGERIEKVPAEFVRRSGERGAMLVTFQLLDIAGEQFALGMLVDVTELLRAERARQENEDRFRHLVESIHQVFTIVDIPRDAVIYVSPKFESVWGRSCADFYRSRDVWRDSLHPDDRARVLAAAETTTARDLTYRILRPDGTTRWIRDRFYPLLDGQGASERVVAVAEDITDRKLLEEQFLRAQRLEAIGTLACGVVHDINNILAPIMIIAPLLEPKLGPHDAELLHLVQASARRGGEVVRQLLSFSRGLDTPRGPMQIGHLLSEITRLARETFPRNISVSRRVLGELPLLEGDPTQLHQTLLNLAVNARDAMPDGGELVFAARAVNLTADELRLHRDARETHYVVVSVTDTGSGIPAELQERIFDPFFTTKPAGEGTGLGLATVRAIARNHGGFVVVASAPARGSTFEVYLPALSRPAGAAPAAAGAAPSVAGAGRTILIVEDEASVAGALASLLRRAGFRVLVAANGHEALHLYEHRAAAVDAVFTDLMMPGADGFTVIHRLRGLAPGLRFVAMTGLATDETRARLAALGVTTLLPKPFTADAVLHALGAALAR